jgi:hypothetical protein
LRRALANFRAASPWPAPDYSSLDPGETTTDRAVCPDIVSFLFPHEPRFAQGVDILAQDWLLLPYLGEEFLQRPVQADGLIDLCAETRPIAPRRGSIWATRKFFMVVGPYMREFSSSRCAIVAKTTHANRFGCGNRALVLNFVFTRVVNHCVTVVGLQGPVARLDGGAESSESVTTES